MKTSEVKLGQKALLILQELYNCSVQDDIQDVMNFIDKKKDKDLIKYLDDGFKDIEPKNEEWEKVFSWAQKVSNLSYDVAKWNGVECICFGVDNIDGGIIHMMTDDQKTGRDNSECELDITEESFDNQYSTATQAIKFIKSGLKLYKEDKKGNLIKVDISKIKI